MGGPGAENDQRVINLQNRIAIVDEFAGIRKLSKSDPDHMVSVCEKMLAMPDIEQSVRIGDIFAQLVEHYSEVRSFEDAHRTVERMRAKGIILTPYIDHQTLEAIYKAVDQPVPEAEQAAVAPAVAVGEELDGVEEEIEEDM